MLVVGIGTMALIIVLSVFNGLEGLLRSTYGSFDAEVIVSATQGKSFVYTDDLKTKIEGSEAVDLIAEVIEDNVLIKYKNAQRVVRMKGVSESFIDQQRLQNFLQYTLTKRKWAGYMLVILLSFLGVQRLEQKKTL